MVSTQLLPASAADLDIVPEGEDVPDNEGVKESTQ